ncbi:hypothetical protein F5X96DRAFT_663410 [Biscogniauxia mediterranea]|nr:hypothetical protein F5X96DRAFT_663410 [Biscogniauxia mediterranea]
MYTITVDAGYKKAGYRSRNNTRWGLNWTSITLQFMFIKSYYTGNRTGGGVTVQVLKVTRYYTTRFLQRRRSYILPTPHTLKYHYHCHCFYLLPIIVVISNIFLPSFMLITTDGSAESTSYQSIFVYIIYWMNAGAATKTAGPPFAGGANSMGRRRAEKEQR